MTDLILIIIELTATGVIEVIFAARLGGRPVQPVSVVLYVLVLLFEDALLSGREVAVLLVLTLQILTLYAWCRMVLREPESVSWIAAVLAGTVSMLSFGIVSSAWSLIVPLTAAAVAMTALRCAILATAILLYALCLLWILRCLKTLPEFKFPQAFLLLFPVLFFLGSATYVNQTAYSSTSLFLDEAAVREHTTLLGLQILGLGALLCTILAYSRVIASLQMQSALVSLKQQAAAQKIYITEAKERYERTRAFRHDIRNHLLVLSGLHQKRALSETEQYLSTLLQKTDELSLPFQTGNPVIDILIASKLEKAAVQGITTEIAVHLPEAMDIDDYDLSAIFANALDNAVAACEQAGNGAWLRISSQTQGQMCLLRFENSCLPETLPELGTGLRNIQAAAEKYGGTMLVESGNAIFSLSVLLSSSGHDSNISDQIS